MRISLTEPGWKAFWFDIYLFILVCGFIDLRVICNWSFGAGERDDVDKKTEVDAELENG